jgi:hypothetical protein
VHDAEVESPLQIVDRLAERDALPAAVGHEEHVRPPIAVLGERPQHAHDRRHADAAADEHIARRGIAIGGEGAVRPVDVCRLAALQLPDRAGEVAQLFDGELQPRQLRASLHTRGFYASS